MCHMFLYIGRGMWNKAPQVKDVDGKRISSPYSVGIIFGTKIMAIQVLWFLRNYLLGNFLKFLERMWQGFQRRSNIFEAC